MAVQPLSPATRLRLGEPLPHQLPDRTQVAPSAHCCFHLSAYGVLATVSRSCPPPQGTSLCFTHPSAAISSKIHRSLIQKKPPNLHVLSTPPAFILSQDQTLRKKSAFLSPPYLLGFSSSFSFVKVPLRAVQPGCPARNMGNSTRLSPFCLLSLFVYSPFKFTFFLSSLADFLIIQ